MSVKLSYFDITGLGEPIRYLLTYGNEKFEDFRVERSKWPEMKPTTPFGQVPVYEEGARRSNQSVAICRYLGKKYNLMGSDDWENLEIDAVVDTINDLRLKIAPYHYDTDQSVKEKLGKVLFGETLPFYIERLEKIAKENNGHLAAKKLTWADFYFAGLLGYLNTMAKRDIIEGRPNLCAARDAVYNIPSIKAWNSTHPQEKI